MSSREEESSCKSLNFALFAPAVNVRNEQADGVIDGVIIITLNVSV